MKAFIITVSAIIILGIVGYFMTAGIGKPISSDLSLIKNGKPALVLAYENFSPNGGAALNRLREIRAEYDSRLEFIIADLGTPQGTAFANQYELVDGLAVFINQDGQAQKLTGIPNDPARLKALLETELAKQ